MPESMSSATTTESVFSRDADSRTFLGVANVLIQGWEYTVPVLKTQLKKTELKAFNGNR
jgi:hypothetical protein